jgi:hypothetical protein
VADAEELAVTKLAKPNKLVTALRRRRNPVQAQRLCDLYGGRRRAWRRRAEYSAGMVIGTKDGYVMTAKATQAQMNNWRARYNGQIQEMKARKRVVERIFYKAICARYSLKNLLNSFNREKDVPKRMKLIGIRIIK